MALTREQRERFVKAVERGLAQRRADGSTMAGMSYSVSLSGHFSDESKQQEALAIVRKAAGELDAITDREAGDTFSGYMSGNNISVSFPEAPEAPAPSGDPAASTDAT